MHVLTEQWQVHPRGVVHLGAHLGEEAPDYALAGVKKVVWVEGNPVLIPGLSRAIAGYPGQQALLAVITDQDAVDVNLHIASFSMSSSILPMTGHLHHYPSIVEIGLQRSRSTTIDSLLVRENIPFTDFDMLNVDLEGAELIAMRGALQLLPHINHIYSEVYFEDMYAGCALIDELDEFLDEHGFARVLTKKAYYEDLFKGFGDALYQRKKQ